MNKINIYAFADEASRYIDGQIEAMKRNGLNGLEIRGVDGSTVTAISLEKAKEIKKKLDDNGLITWSIGSPIGKINIGDSFDGHIEKFKYLLEMADILDCKNIRMFSFYMPKDEKPEIYKNEVIDRLGILLDLAKDSGVAVCHENEKGIYGDIPERCLDLHKALPELKGIFDPANFVQCGADTLAGWEMLKPYIHYMHIKDAKIDGTVVPAGYGAGNVQEIAKKFIEAGGRDFTIEPHLAVFDGFAKLEKPDDNIAEFTFDDSNVAFDTACNSFKALIK